MARIFKSSLTYTKRKYNGFTIYGIRYSAYDRPERYDVVRNEEVVASFDRQRDAVNWIDGNGAVAEKEFRLTEINTNEVVWKGQTIKEAIEWREKSGIDEYLLVITEFEGDEFIHSTTFEDVYYDEDPPETLRFYA